MDRRVDLHLSRERYQEMSTRGFGFDAQVALSPRIRHHPGGAAAVGLAASHVEGFGNGLAPLIAHLST